MSTPSTEVKAAVSQEAANLSGDIAKAKAQIEAKFALEHGILASRVRALEFGAKSFYEKHIPLIAVIAGFLIGLLVGHLL